MLSINAIAIVLLVLLAGFWLYISIARRDARPWDLRSFFLASGKLGTDLTENNTIGMTFAWAGGIWYFTTVAYQYGPEVLASQVPWCLGVILLAYLFRLIIKYIKSHTIHGYLGQRYGIPVQRIAAVATTLGYLLNGGFEICWASYLFSACLGQESLRLPIAVGLAIFVGAYCTIGGYRSNATVDKPHNILGVLSLAMLVGFVADHLKVTGPLITAVWVFIGGSAVYIGMSLLSYRKGFRLSNRIQTWIAIAFAVAAGAVVVGLTPRDVVASLPSPNAPPLDTFPLFLIVATVPFQLIFNSVDMQNWQQAAANESEPRTEHRKIAFGIFRASLYLLWFPALGGVLLGCIMRAAPDAINPNTIFPAAFQMVLTDQNEFVRGFVIGVLLLGFISTSMSTIDTLLMSATQTTWYDIVMRKRIERAMRGEGPPGDGTAIARSAQAFLVPFAVLMALFFYGLWQLYGDNVLLFQPIMYALPLSLFGPVAVSMIEPRSVATATGQVAVFVSIAGAIASVVGLYIYSSLPGQSADIKNWAPAIMPVVSIGWGLVGAAFAFAGLRRSQPIIEPATFE